MSQHWPKSSQNISKCPKMTPCLTSPSSFWKKKRKNCESLHSFWAVCMRLYSFKTNIKTEVNHCPKFLPNIAKMSQMSQNVLECPRMSQNVPERPRTSQNVPECPRMSPNVQKCPRLSLISQNVKEDSKCSKMSQQWPKSSQNVSKCPKMTPCLTSSSSF